MSDRQFHHLQTDLRARGPTIFSRSKQDEQFLGHSFTKMIIARALETAARRRGEHMPAAQIAAERWADSHLASVIQKAAVAGGGTGAGEWGAELATSDARFTGDFIEHLHGATVFDRLPLRPVPARIRIRRQDGAAIGYWAGESKAIPATDISTSDVELRPLKVTAMAAVSMELLQDATPSAELLIRDLMSRAMAERIDATFLSDAAAVANESPAGLLQGLTPLSPSGTDAAAVHADLARLYASFLAAKNGTDLAQVMSPTLARAISLCCDTAGNTVFSGLNANGGTLLGDPVFTSDQCADDDWIVLKPSDIWKIGDSGIRVQISDEALIEQNDAPQGAGDTPTAASATLVSLWQTDMVGMKLVRQINYAKRRSGVVQYLTGAEYGAVLS